MPSVKSFAVPMGSVVGQSTVKDDQKRSELKIATYVAFHTSINAVQDLSDKLQEEMGAFKRTGQSVQLSSHLFWHHISERRWRKMLVSLYILSIWTKQQIYPLTSSSACVWSTNHRNTVCEYLPGACWSSQRWCSRYMRCDRCFPEWKWPGHQTSGGDCYRWRKCYDREKITPFSHCSNRSSLVSSLFAAFATHWM